MSDTTNSFLEFGPYQFFILAVVAAIVFPPSLLVSIPMLIALMIKFFNDPLNN